MRQNPSVLLVSHVQTGHMPSHVNRFFKLFRQLGCHVGGLIADRELLLAAISPSSRHFEFVDLYKLTMPAAWQPRLEVTSRRQAAHILLCLRRSINAVGDERLRQPDLVFFANADLFLDIAKYLPLHPMLRWALPLPWGGVWQSPTHTKERRSVLLWARALSSNRDRFLRHGTCKLLLSPQVDSFTGSLQVNPQHLLTAMPEIADLSPGDPGAALVREVTRRAKGRPIVAILGQVSDRKNLRAFLRLARDQRLARAFFVVAGPLANEPIDPAVLAQLRHVETTGDERLGVFLARVPEGAVFNGLLTASTVIYLVYENFVNSSNVLTKCAHFRRPALVSPHQLMARQVSDFGLGAVMAAADHDGSVVAINALIEGQLSGLVPDATGASRFAELHSEERMQKLLASALL